MTENPERRQFLRKKPEQLVYLELERDNGGMMLNVSEEGFSFRAVRPVRQEEKIRFAFTIDAGRQLGGHGELEWTDEEGKVGGMRFAEVSREFREEIRQWLKESHAPGDRGKNSVPTVATPVDTLEEHRWDVKAEPRKSLPQALEVEKPGIARETRSATEQLAMNRPQHDKRTALLLEQVQLRVKEKSTASERNSCAVTTCDMEEPKVLGEPRERKLEERIQALEELLRAREIPSPRLNRAAAAVRIVLMGLTVLLVPVVYNFRHDIGESLIWLGERMSGESKQARAETLEAPTNVSESSPSGRPVADTPTEPDGIRVAPVEAEPNPSVNDSNVASPVTEEEEPGQSELAAAVRILESKNGSRDITGAMKLLWAAVEKGNTAAVLRLSELYIRGEVTQKNCDQARILLATAAKRGDAGARAKLQQLDKEGCP
jgi:hypothetical protein